MVKRKTIIGTFRSNAKGYGFVVPEEKDLGDVFVLGKNLNTAMPGDTVEVEVTKGEAKEKCAEGKIINIIERKNESIVGKFEKSGAFGFVVPFGTSTLSDVFVSKKNINGAKHGQVVVVKIVEWPRPSKRHTSPEGEIVEILGYEADAGVDVMSVIRSHGIRTEFPKKVVEQAAKIPLTLSVDDIAKEIVSGRKDKRNDLVITIDGETAKDLDDAVSVKKLRGGKYQLDVHIADVAHYVKQDSEIDKEALLRGTSVYFVDRVVPMLPQQLSNGICSLNPQVDRFAMSCSMVINSDGKIIKHEIYESVIKTVERMTYTDVFNILANKPEDLCKRYSHIVPMLEDMYELSKILRAARTRRGSIDFDFDESIIIVNEFGKPVDVVRAERNLANELIEDFMLAANETVAEHFNNLELPFMYRVHEAPSPEKMGTFAAFISNMGYKLPSIENPQPEHFQKIINDCHGTQEEQVISTVMLRSLQKAKYSAQNSMHFGLAAEFYTHFTSPIRRYPDLIVHRLIKYYSKKVQTKQSKKLVSDLAEIAANCSECEVLAETAERDVEDIKKFELMKDHVGEEYEGVISGVTSFGLFVELENTCEGLIPLGAMQDDYYEYFEKEFCVIGQKNGKKYRIGDKIQIVIVKADDTSKKLEFQTKELFEKYKAGFKIEEAVKPYKKKSDFSSRDKEPNRQTKRKKDSRDRNQKAISRKHLKKVLNSKRNKKSKNKKKG